MRNLDLQTMLDVALNNAVNNGHNLHEWEPQAVAEDLILYSKDFENMTPETLMPYIEVWQREKRTAAPYKHA
jgi:hypothetical protein